MGFKTYLARRKARAREKAAFRKIVEKRTTQVKRKAFEKEALKKAEEEGKLAAREGGLLSRFTKKVVEKATQSPRRIASRRRVIRRTTTRKRLTPKKRVVKKRIVKRTRKITQPSKPKSNGSAFMQFGDLYS